MTSPVPPSQALVVATPPHIPTPAHGSTQGAKGPTSAAVLTSPTTATSTYSPASPMSVGTGGAEAGTPRRRAAGVGPAPGVVGQDLLSRCLPPLPLFPHSRALRRFMCAVLDACTAHVDAVASAGLCQSKGGGWGWG